jgi:hypothetical protein
MDHWLQVRIFVYQRGHRANRLGGCARELPRWHLILDFRYYGVIVVDSPTSMHSEKKIYMYIFIMKKNLYVTVTNNINLKKITFFFLFL